MTKCFPILFVLALSGTTLLGSQLVWKNPKIEIKALPGSTRTSAQFLFQNTGQDPVEIKNVTSSCSSCTTTQVEKKIYQPGEDGRIDVTFNYAGRHGLQQRIFTVETNDKMASPQVLILSVDIPDLVSADKKTLLWLLGGPAESQQIDLTVPNGLKLVFGSPRISNENFQASLQEIEKDRIYRLKVTPVSTATAMTANLELNVSNSLGNTSDTLYFCVRVGAPQENKTVK